MSGLIQDFRFAIRSLARSPGFTLLCVAILALGIGAVAAIFSLTQAVLLQPLPYRDADRLMVGWEVVEGVEGQWGSSFPTFEDLGSRNRAFEAVASFTQLGLNLSGGDAGPERLVGLLVSAEFPRLLGIEPILGRGLAASDDRLDAERTVVLSHELWSRRFGADQAILSQSITLNDLEYSVVGILPPGLKDRRLGAYLIGDFWAPLGLFRDPPSERREESNGLFLLGRLRPGVEPEDGQRDVERVARELAADYPLMRKTSFVAVDVMEDAVGAVRPMLYLLLGAVGFVLVIACANLANLLLGRTGRRCQELATRMAVGAGRLRLVCQVLTETLVLGLLGGAVGLLLARSSLEALSASLLSDTMGYVDVAIGLPVLILSVAMTMTAVFASGLVPALQASKVSFYRSARSVSARHRVEKILVGLEVAIALVLWVGAFLMLSSLLRLRQQDPGFDPKNVLSAQVNLAMPKYSKCADRVDFFDQALAEIARLPGVRSAAVTSSLPLSGSETLSRVAVAGRPLPPTPELEGTRYQLVSPGFFKSMGIPLLSGRDFSSRDDDRHGGEHVVIINQTLADFFWPDPNDQPLGQRVAFELKGTPEQTEFLWRKVIGVVGDVRHTDLKSVARNSVYLPYTQSGLWFESGWPPMVLVAKTANDPVASVQAVRAALLKVDPSQPISGIQSLSEVLAAQVGQQESLFRLLMAFAVVAVVLAMIGVYGVVAQAVTHSRREIGTCMALGATPGQVVWGIVKRNMLLLFGGLAAGLIAAAGFSRSLSSLLYGVGVLDPIVYLAAAFVLAVVGMLAILIPARQAVRVDPSEILRQD